MSLILLPSAVDDIAHEVAYLNEHNPASAESFRQAVVKSLRLIASNDKVGRPSETHDIREWSMPEWPYVIPYRIAGQDVEILRIWHTRRRRPGSW